MRPAWAVGFSPGLALRMGNPQVITHGPHGWDVKILWVVAPAYRQRVTLHGSALGGGAPLWFQIGDQAPSTAPILDPQAPPIPNQPAGWANFPSYLFILRAGCYVLEATTWPGGIVDPSPERHALAGSFPEMLLRPRRRRCGLT